jgi:hypothetical protein
MKTPKIPALIIPIAVGAWMLCVMQAAFGDPAANPALRLESDAGIVLDGSNISSWADQSGFNHDATQPTQNLEPVLVPGVFNGHPALRFNGAADFLNVTGTDLGGHRHERIDKLSGDIFKLV